MSIPLALQLLSFLLGGGRRDAEQKKASTIADSIQSDLKLNTRFFLAANISLVLFVLVLILVPCMVVLKTVDRGLGLACVVGVVLSLTLSVMYLVKKGDLGWVRSFFRS